MRIYDAYVSQARRLPKKGRSETLRPGKEMIVGTGITAVNANALHINGLWANGIPFYYAALPGTVMWQTVSSLASTDKVLVIA